MNVVNSFSSKSSKALYIGEVKKTKSISYIFTCKIYIKNLITET